MTVDAVDSGDMLPRELQLLGVRVLGPPPVEDVYFDLSDGFRALYGLNGAGKTRLLNAVSDLLAGRRHGDGYVVVRVHAPESDQARSGPLLSGIVSSAVRRFDDAGRVLPVSRVIAEMLGDPDRDDDRIFSLSSFLAEQGIWVLQPAGDEVGWHAVPGFLADERFQTRVEPGPELLGLLGRTTGASPMLGSSVLAHPLLSSGPLARAAQNNDQAALAREAAALGQATLRPYPLVSCDHPRAHLVGDTVQIADVVTNRELTPDLVTRGTVRIIEQRLEDLGEMPLQKALREFAAGARTLDPESPTALSSYLWAQEMAEQLSITASELLSEALPGDLEARCALTPASESGDALTWKVAGAQHDDLDLRDLSEAQRRWACLAIAYATNYFKRRQYAEDVEYDKAYAAAQDIDEERDHLEYQIAEVQNQLDALEHLERNRIGEGDGRDLEDDNGVSWESRYAALDGRTEYEGRLEFLKGELEDLAAGEPSESPTESQIAAALKREFELLPISLFLDEPEAGLHRTAERGVVRLLQSIARIQGFPVTVATHSPIFLEPDGAEPLLVYRGDDGNTRLDIAPGVLQRTAASLGISPLERLGLYRTILLVEGRHDEIILREFFGDELARMRVLVLAMHGGRLMPTAADSLLLADFSEHRVFAMVDNSSQRVFEQLIALARSTTPGDEQAYLDGSAEILAGEKRDEHVFISRLVGRAHSQGLLDRFGAIALSKGDILEYLPSAHFVDGSRSWEDLHAAFGTQQKIRPFKEWAARKRRGDFSDAAVERACRSMDSVPIDLQQVLNHLAAAQP